MGAGCHLGDGAAVHRRMVCNAHVRIGAGCLAGWCDVVRRAGTPVKYSIRIDGKPVPKGRANPKVINGKVRMFTPATTKHFEASVGAAWTAAGHPLLVGPVAVEVEVAPDHMTITAWEVDLHDADGRLGGDLDNYIKTVDGLNGIAWHDDKQVVTISAKKFGDI